MNQPIAYFDLSSHDIAAQKREALLHLFPEVHTERGKIDFARLKLALGEVVDIGKERYGLTWPGKADCFKTIQAPSLGTLLPAPEESVNFDTTENLIIEGDNLEVLKLLQKSYLGKVKMIYIDPPYNTGNDFIYPDDYNESLQTYLEYTGQVDGQGRRWSTNSEEDGRFHSKWLNMMYPRLYLAHNLLREDGVIFISIDENEVENLRRICSEIFGETNFISQVTVLSNPRGRQSDTFLATVHEYVVIYARNIEECQLAGMTLTEAQKAEFNLVDATGQRYRQLGLRQRGSASRREDRPEMFFPIYVNPNTLKISLEQSSDFHVEVLPRKSTGEDGRWMWGRQRVRKDIDLTEAKLIGRRNEYDIFVRDYLNKNGQERERKVKTIWDEKAFNTQNGTQEVKFLIDSDAMPYPKASELIKLIIGMGITSSDDIALDFFTGSGTTAQAVFELNQQDGGNRKFILVQLPEPTGRTDYPTVVEITKERVRRVIQKLNEADAGRLPLDGVGEQDRGFRVFKLAESNLQPWEANAPKDAKSLAHQLNLHINHIRKGRQEHDILYELMLKSGFPLTTPIETLTLAGKRVYSVAEGALLICLERGLTLELIRSLAARTPQRVLCLDEGFAGNDQLKANTVQIFKTKHIVSFMTV